LADHHDAFDRINLLVRRGINPVGYHTCFPRSLNIRLFDKPTPKETPPPEPSIKQNARARNGRNGDGKGRCVLPGHGESKREKRNTPHDNGED
jgi:hypothetical protein